MPALHFSLARAGSAPALARAFAEGQRRALSHHGLAHLVPARPYSAGDDLLVTQTASGSLLADLRLRRRTSGVPLPLEEALALPAWVRRQLNQKTPEGLAEAGAAWVADTAHGLDLTSRLLHLAVELATVSGLRHLVGLSAEHSLPIALGAGFAVDALLPAFPYPDARYRSVVVWRSVPHRCGPLPSTR
jgi:hypothetical protein